MDEHIVELLENEEAGSHALAPWEGIAFRGRRTDHLEEVLSDPQVVLLITLLADHCVHDCFEDVFLGQNALHVLSKA